MRVHVEDVYAQCVLKCARCSCVSMVCVCAWGFGGGGGAHGYCVSMVYYCMFCLCKHGVCVCVHVVGVHDLSVDGVCV